MTQKKIYIPVIAYGGVCRAEYAMSMTGLFVHALQSRSKISFLSTGIFFESLVSRARNSSAAAALHYECDYLLFIDADINFAAEDVFKLINHDEDVVAGVYPKKYFSGDKLFYTASNHPHLFKDTSWVKAATDFATELSPSMLNNIEMGNKLVEVDYGATGFMLIKTKVFHEIIKAKPELKYRNEIDGYSSWGDNFYNFFPAGINPESKKYESEDYGFCNLWKSLGGKILIDPSINLEHMGNYSFAGSLKEQCAMHKEYMKDK